MKKVFLAQQKNPLIGDFAQLVKNDLINLNITQSQVETLPRNDLKKLVKSNAAAAAFKELKYIQGRHSKIKKYNL